MTKYDYLSHPIRITNEEFEEQVGDEALERAMFNSNISEKDFILEEKDKKEKDKKETGEIENGN